MHDAVVLGVVIFGIFGDDERHLGDRLTERHQRLATRPDPPAGGAVSVIPKPARASSTWSKHTRRRAALRFFLPGYRQEP
jgi:hypothetical protein